VIPGADLPGLLAVFNGGFMTRHGAWGMMIAGEVFLPPREDGCTVALYRDGSVRIRTFSALSGSVADLLAYRQTPPCLVEQGSVHEALLGGDKPRRWGLSETGGLDIRRSALGLADGGRTLLYGLGEWITPRALAEAMRAPRDKPPPVEPPEQQIDATLTVSEREPSTPRSSTSTGRSRASCSTASRRRRRLRPRWRRR